jgi:hypothetical protein
MSKTAFSKRVDILGYFHMMYGNNMPDDKAWQQFISEQDIGLPLAFFSMIKVATITRLEGVKCIEETWKNYCEVLGINPENKYVDMQDTFDVANKNRES